MKKVLFLAPAYNYAKTTIKNVTEDLDKHHIGYGACSDRGNMKIRTDAVEVEFVHSDPVAWTEATFHGYACVFGKKELVNAANDRFFRMISRPKQSLSRYLIEVNKYGPEALVDDLVPAKTQYIPEIKVVHFNDPMTIVIWEDGTKTMVKCQDGDVYSEELGLAMCISKKALGNKGNFNKVFRKWVPETKTLPMADGVKFNTNIDGKSAIDAATDYLDKIFEEVRNKFRGAV